jgi:F-type H+-transporting ATPase subunit delta
LAGVGDDPGALDRIATDLSAIDRLVATSPVLLSAITDTSVPALARRAILADLLDNKVVAPARRLAAFAAGAVAAPKVPIALEWLAERGRRVSEGALDVATTLSFRAARERVGGFAAAIFEDTPTEELDEIEDELFRFTRIVQSTPSLRSALTNPELPQSIRGNVAAQLLEGKVRPATSTLVGYVLSAGRTRDVVGTLDWLVEQTARARGWRVARVRAASEVGAEQQERLSASLATLAGSPVELQVVVDPSLLSGAIVDVGDLRVDATARGRLNEMREQLVPAGWEEGGFSRLGDSSAANQEGDR